MEYLFIFGAAFMGGFLGALTAGWRGKDTPLPIEKTMRKVVKAVTGKSKPAADPDPVERWLYHEDQEVRL